MIFKSKLTKMDFNKFTIKSQEAIQQAQLIAEQEQHGSIETAHLLKGIFLVDQDVIPYLFQKLKCRFQTS
jgi:ATP-dependent Clp protease ATP-binding subunit ClpB